MYRTPAAARPRFSIRETTRRAAVASLIAACLFLALNVAVAGWLVIDHYGFLRSFFTTGYGPSRQATQALVFLGLLPLTLGRVGLTWWRLRRNVSPAVRRRLAQLGEPDAVAAEIAAELEVETEVARVGPLTISPSWLVYEHAGGFELARLRDAVWAYARVTSLRVNGLPVVRTRGVEIHTREQRFGAALSIPMPDADAAAALAALAERAPWILLGHDEAREKRWYADRAGMIAECDRRRERVSADRPR